MILLEKFKNILNKVRIFVKKKVLTEIEIELSQVLIECSRVGDLDRVRYLLTSPELKEHADIHARHDDALKNACSEGHLELVKYLLTSPDLKEHANIHANSDLALIEACSYGHVNVVQYLLTSPDLKEHANIKAQGNSALMLACIYKQLDLIQYLIFDYGIEKNKDIEQYLVNNNKQEIINMFDKRELEKKLQIIIIPGNNKINKKTKI